MQVSKPFFFFKIVNGLDINFETTSELDQFLIYKEAGNFCIALPKDEESKLIKEEKKINKK